MVKGKGVRVRTQAEAERIVVDFLTALMRQGSRIVVQTLSGPHEVHLCNFRGRRVSVDCVGKMRIDGLVLPAGVWLAVSTEFRNWTIRRVEDQRVRNRRVVAHLRPKRLCKLAEDLASGGY